MHFSQNSNLSDQFGLILMLAANPESMYLAG
jgi:hypothetical protein